MRSLIKLLCLGMLYFEALPIAINIYYMGKSNTDSAMRMYQSFQDKGISSQLISVKEKKNPCSMTYENSFIDLCINENGEMEVIRKTSWSHESLKPLTRERLEKSYAL